MKVSTTSLAAVLACAASVAAAPASVEANDIVVKREAQLLSVIASLDELTTQKAKRDAISQELSQRDYAIVTEVLSALNDTDLSEDIIHFLATDPTLSNITVLTVVAVLKSGLVNLDTLLSALVQSGLINQVIQDVISDCQIYVDLFTLAESLISGLVQKVEAVILDGISSLKREDTFQTDVAMLAERATVNPIVLNLLESLKNSGLASSVVKSILTDSSYIPFAEKLIAGILASDALNILDTISAVTDSGLLGSLFKQIFSLSTVETVVTNAFAALSGTCNGGKVPLGGSSSGGSSSGSGSGTKTPSTNPCKKRRRKRARRTNYNY